MTLQDELLMAENAPFVISLFKRAADKLDRLERENEALRYVISRAARVMHGDGVEDQGEAWDQCLRILDAAMKEQKP